MADSAGGATPQGGGGNRGRSQSLSEWLASQAGGFFFNLLLTAITAGGGTFLYQELSTVERELAEINNFVESIKGSQKMIDESQKDIKDAQGRISREISNARRDLAFVSQDVVVILRDHRDHEAGLDSLAERLASLFENSDEISEDLDSLESTTAKSATDIDDALKRVEEIDQAQQESLDKLYKLAEDLSKRLDTNQSTIVVQLGKLVKEGDCLINGDTDRDLECDNLADGDTDRHSEGDNPANGDTDRDFEKLRQWVLIANYIVRSLSIPTESGLIRDTSIVKEKLRKETRQFLKENDGDKRKDYAREILLVVEAVRGLALGGRAL